MPASASPSGRSRWWQKLPPRVSTTAISPRCFMRRAIAARSLSRGRIRPRLGGGWPSEARSVGVLLGVAAQSHPARKSAPPSPKTGRDKASLQAQRHEAQFAIRIGDKQQRRLTAFLLELLDPLLQCVGIGDRLLRHLDHDVAPIETLVAGGGLGFSPGDHHPLHPPLALLTLAPA